MPTNYIRVEFCLNNNRSDIFYLGEKANLNDFIQQRKYKYKHQLESINIERI